MNWAERRLPDDFDEWPESARLNWLKDHRNVDLFRLVAGRLGVEYDTGGLSDSDLTKKELARFTNEFLRQEDEA